MLRVLQLSAPTGLAGAERVMLNYLQNHDANCYSARVASFLNYQRMDNPFTAALVELGIAHDKVTVGNNGLARQIYETYRVLKRYDIHVLHTHGYCSDFIGLIAARLARIPIVSTVHGWTAMTTRQQRFEMLDRFCLKRFDSVVCVSSPLHREFAQLGIGSDRLFYLPNAVSVPEKVPGQREAARQKLGLAADLKMVVAIGRLSPEKGLEVLLTAFARQFANDRQVRLFLVGLFLFVKLLISSIKAIRECRLHKRLGPESLWLLDGIEVAFYGFITTAFFLSQAYSAVFYLLIAFAVIILKLEGKVKDTVPIPADESTMDVFTPHKVLP